MKNSNAPELAIAFAYEQMGDVNAAINVYRRISKVDPRFTTACFGLARCLRKQNKISDSADALLAVPASHSMYTQARILMAKVLMSDEQSINANLLSKIGEALKLVTVDSSTVHQLVGKLFSYAIRLIKDNLIPESSDMLFECSLEEKILRQGAEARYLNAAKLAKNPDDKIRLTDLANQIRPITWI